MPRQEHLRGTDALTPSQCLRFQDERFRYANTVMDQDKISIVSEHTTPLSCWDHVFEVQHKYCGGLVPCRSTSACSPCIGLDCPHFIDLANFPQTDFRISHKTPRDSKTHRSFFFSSSQGALRSSTKHRRESRRKGCDFKASVGVATA